MRCRIWITNIVLLAAVVVIGASLAAWKANAIEASSLDGGSQPEPMEAVSAALAEPYQAQATTTATGTVLAARSVTLRNEILPARCAGVRKATTCS